MAIIKAETITEETVNFVEERFKGKTPSVENVQDIVIEVLRKDGYEKVALAYEDYRQKKEELRKLRGILGVEPKLNVNAMEVLKARYLLRDDRQT